MKLLKKVITVVGIVSVLAASVLLSGCGSTPEQYNCAVVYANRQNSSASPALIQQEIENVVASRGYFDIIRADGNPTSSIVTGTYLGSTSENESTRDYENQALSSQALQAVYDTNAEAQECDIISALEMAARSLSAAKDGKKVIAVADSGVATKGIVDFTQEGMLDSDTQKFVSYLKENNLLADLSGVDEVIWYGFGDVGDTQEALPNNTKAHLQDLYEEILYACGVTTVVFDNSIGAANYVDSSALPKVTPVSMPATPKFSGAGSSVKLTQAILSFEADSAEYLNHDETKAKEVLAEYGRALASDASLKAKVCGYTATTAQCPNGDKDLAQARADKVKETLIELGAKDGQISAQGMGAGPVNDRASDGSQIETLAAQNRYVEIVFS